MLWLCFQLPEDFEVMFDEAAGEITIGGIYLRLFIQQPAWVGSFKEQTKDFLNICGFLMVFAKARLRFSQILTQLANQTLKQNHGNWSKGRETRDKGLARENM